MTIADEIFEWLTSRYADNPTDWIDADFHCFEDIPKELRWLPYTEKVEFEIQNGGLPQLLWNVFYHWRVIMSTTVEGYAEMGFEMESSALRRFSDLFHAHEAKCKRYILLSARDQDFGYFSRWCSEASDELTVDDEKLFFTTSGLRERRIAWMEENRDLFVRLMATCPPRT